MRTIVSSTLMYSRHWLANILHWVVPYSRKERLNFLEQLFSKWECTCGMDGRKVLQQHHLENFISRKSYIWRWQWPHRLVKYYWARHCLHPKPELLFTENKIVAQNVPQQKEERWFKINIEAGRMRRNGTGVTSEGKQKRGRRHCSPNKKESWRKHKLPPETWKLT